MPDPSTKPATAPPRAAAARGSRATGSAKRKSAAAAPSHAKKKVAAKSAAKKKANKSTAKSTAKRRASARRSAGAAPTAPPLGETVVEAVRRDLEAIARFSDEGKAHATGALAMSAIALAKSIDHDRTSPTARSMCARALTETLEKLRGMVPDEGQEGDGIDDLAERRQRRRARGATA